MFMSFLNPRGHRWSGFQACNIRRGLFRLCRKTQHTHSSVCSRCDLAIRYKAILASKFAQVSNQIRKTLFYAIFMNTDEAPRSLQGPFSPGWVATTVKADQTPKAEKEVKSAKKQTSGEKKSTPKRRHTSPQSEFGYDDAYTPGGDDFTEGTAQKLIVKPLLLLVH